MGLVKTKQIFIVWSLCACRQISGLFSDQDLLSDLISLKPFTERPWKQIF